MSNPKPLPWRVRVAREIEDWVEVLAHTPEEANAEALKLPGVKALRGITLRGDKRADAPMKMGVEEEED